MFDITKTAVIDIGSNSVRLMLPVLNNKLNYKELNSTVLAENLTKTGFLSAEAMQRTAKTVLDFYYKAKENGFAKIAAFATAAVRSAKNGAEFVKDLAESGVSVDVISGGLEAECGFSGATLNFPDGVNAVFDIGGASVELAYGKDGKIISAKSLPLGVHVLRDTFGSDRTALEKYVFERINEFDILPFDRLIGISGTATSIAAIVLKLNKYDPLKVHLSQSGLSDVDRLIDSVFSLGSPDLIKEVYPCLSLNRARVISYGLIVTKAILSRINAKCFIASENDNTEGYAKLFCQ